MIKMLQRINWRLLLDCVIALYPFLGGATIVYDWVHRHWGHLWLMVALSLGMAVALVMRACAIHRMVKANDQMRELLEQGSDALPRLLIENVRCYAVIAGLTGIRMNMKVVVEKAR